MRNRIKSKIIKVVNTLTNEVRDITLSHIAQRKLDFQMSQQFDKDCKDIKIMRFKASQNNHRVESFMVGLYGE